MKEQQILQPLLNLCFLSNLDHNPRHVRCVEREKYQSKNVFEAVMYTDTTENNFTLAKNDLCVIKLDAMDANSQEIQKTESKIV